MTDTIGPPPRDQASIGFLAVQYATLWALTRTCCSLLNSPGGPFIGPVASAQKCTILDRYDFRRRIYSHSICSYF
jgi:hypothetical protein